MSKQELIEGVLLLPAKDREQIYNLLGESLDKQSDAKKAEIEREWAQVAMRRLEEIESGKVATRSVEEVFARVSRHFKK